MDDLKLRVVGSPSHVVKIVPLAVARLIRSLEGRKCLVSLSKTKLMATSDRLAGRIAEGLRRRGISLLSTRAARDLGVDTACGTRRAQKVSAARLT